MKKLKNKAIKATKNVKGGTADLDFNGRIRHIRLKARKRS